VGRLGLELGQYPADRESDSGPSRQRQGVSLEEDRQQDAENLARRGDRRQDQGIKVGNRVENKGLPDGGADGEAADLVHDLGVGEQKGASGADLTEGSGDDDGREAHEKIRPEHKIVRFGLDADLGGFGLEAFLESRRDTVQHKRHDDVGDTHEAAVTAAGGFLLAHGHNGGTADDGRDLEVFAKGVGGTSQQEGSGHDGCHLAALGEGGDGETQTVGQGQTGAGLSGDLGGTGDSEHAKRNSLGGSRELHAEESDDDVGQGLEDLEEPCLFEGGPIDGRDVPKDVLLEGTVIQEGGVDTAGSDQELGAVGETALGLSRRGRVG